MSSKKGNQNQKKGSPQITTKQEQKKGSPQTTTKKQQQKQSPQVQKKVEKTETVLKQKEVPSKVGLSDDSASDKDDLFLQKAQEKEQAAKDSIPNKDDKLNGKQRNEEIQVEHFQPEISKADDPARPTEEIKEIPKVAESQTNVDKSTPVSKKEEIAKPKVYTQRPAIQISATALNAPVVWAQRKDQIFLSITLQDIKEPSIDVQPTKLTFLGTSAGQTYKADLTFFGEIDPAKSKYVVKPRNADFVLFRKEEGAYWPRLLQDKTKFNWLKVDWNKWVDEDEVKENSGFDMTGMEGMDFGGGGMDDDNDSDEDDNLPDLEDQKGKEEEEDKEGKEKEDEEGKEPKKTAEENEDEADLPELEEN